MLRNNRVVQGGIVTVLLLLLGIPGSVLAVDGNTDIEPERLTDPAYLRQVLETAPESIVLVDVRTAGEYNSGHIPRALNIPHTEIAGNPPVDDRDAVIVLYCRSGSRSSMAERALRRLGYTEIVDFGGVVSWPNALER
jgi:phage shock protein E